MKSTRSVYVRILVAPRHKDTPLIHRWERLISSFQNISRCYHRMMALVCPAQASQGKVHSTMWHTNRLWRMINKETVWSPKAVVPQYSSFQIQVYQGKESHRTQIQHALDPLQLCCCSSAKAKAFYVHCTFNVNLICAVL